MTLDVKKDRPMKEALDALFAKENRKFFLWGIGVFVVVLILPPSIFTYIVGGNTPKLEFIKLIGWGMSGLLAILGVMGLFQRAAALDKQNEMTEKGHIHERFKAAIEHLGTKRVSVRIAAFYEFYRLAEIESDLKEPIFDILCAHLRKSTKDKNYQKKKEEPDITEHKKIEIQSLLDILFKEHKDKLIFDGLVANLEGANLQDANLQNAKLQNANLQYVNLQNAKLFGANLQNASLIKADLRRAIMEAYDDMENPHVITVNLHNANLYNVKVDQQHPTFIYWSENYIQKDMNGKAYVFLVDDKGKIIKHL